MRNKVGILVITVVLVWEITTNTGHACQCTCCYNLSDKIVHSDSVFLGRVLSTRVLDGGAHYEAVFEVFQIWKGGQGSPKAVITEIRNENCGVVFNVGWHYLVFEKNGWTGFCLGSYSAQMATDDVRKLGKPIWRNPKAKHWSLGEA